MNVAAPQAQLWDESLWDELLAYLEEGRVIPIVGPTWVVEDQGQRTTLEGYVATRLAAKVALPAGDGDVPVTLNGVVSRYLQQGKRREALYPAIRDIVQEARFEPPQALLRLASITDFNLFVTTSFDLLLEAAIDEARFRGEQRTQSIAYRRDKVQDLDVGKADLVRPTVYHLFGKLAASPIYSICDDDLLEYLFALQAENRPARLFDELQNNHLLVLGGNFSDWLARLFLRMTKRRRLSDPRDVVEILADDRSRQDRDLVFFLSNFSSRTKIFDGDAPEFTEQLWRRWQARNPPRTEAAQPADWMPPNDVPDGAVFISYAREDADAVHRLAAGLRARGIAFWFDLDRDEGSGLQVGDNFDLKIRRGIRSCSRFVAVLSAHTEARLSGYFRREWQYAVDRSLELAEHIPFIMPIVVDDTQRFATLPERIDRAHRIALPGGAMTDELARRLPSSSGAPA